MGFLDKLFGQKKEGPPSAPPSAPPYKYPSKSIINDPDLKSLADFNRYYPLPQDHEYRQRGPRDIVVARKSDGTEFVFLVEEGILAWDVPRQRQDGTLGKRTTEVLKQGGTGPHPGQERGQFGFSLGQNVISDPDIKAFADLQRFYPLPSGFEYQQTAEGMPVVVRQSDSESFYFLIEEELMSFDEPYTKPDGQTGYKTTEVFKRT
jgi:hypothetical protein